MKAKKLVTLTCSLFLLVLTAHLALAFNDAGLVLHYGLNEGVGSSSATAKDSIYEIEYNVTWTGATYVAGFSGASAVDIESSGSEGGVKSGIPAGVLPQYDKSVNVWVTLESDDARRIIELNDGVSDHCHWFLPQWDGNSWFIGGYGSCDWDTGVTDGNGGFSHWQMMTITYNSTNNEAKWYINGTEKASSTSYAYESGAYTIFNLGMANGGGNEWDGKIDELTLWNRTLNPSEVTDLYNGGVGLAYPYPGASDSDSFSVSMLNTSDYLQVTQETVFFQINFTTNLNNSLCILRNSSGTEFSRKVWNLSTNLSAATFPEGNFTLNFTPTIDFTGTFYVNCTATNTSGITLNSSTETRTVTIDTANPQVSTNFTNNTVLVANENVYFAVTDENLYNYNATTKNGSVLDSATNIPETTYTSNITLTYSNYGIGRDFVNVTVADGHTTLAIDDYGVQKILPTKALSYVDRGGSVNIVPKYPLQIIDYGTTKKTDRYEFYYQKTSTDTLSFIITSTHPIDIIQNTKYPGHLVIWELRKWIDFATTSKVKDYTMKRIDATSVEVTLTGVSDDYIVFNSIGDINVVTKTYYFTVPNNTTAYDVTATESESQTMNVTIDLFNASDYYYTNATLYYNNTAMNLTSKLTEGTKTTYSITFDTPAIGTTSTILNWWWNVTIMDSGTDTAHKNYSVAGTQTVDSVVVSICNDTYTTAGLNFTLRDEMNSSYVVGDIEVDFVYWLQGQKDIATYTYSYEGSNSYNYTFCISPTNSTIVSDYTVYYSATDYPQRRLYVSDGIIDKTVTDTDLYLLETSAGLYARFKTVDQYDNPIAGVNIVMNKSVTIEREETDDAGLATFWVNPDEDYTFTFTLTGYETQSFSLRPTSTDIYTVTMSEEGSTQTADYSRGTSHIFLPNIGVLNNKTDYTFRFNITSNYWTITGCWMNLIAANGTILDTTTGTYNNSLCHASIAADTQNGTSIVSQGIWERNNTANITYERSYAIISSYEGEYSLFAFLRDDMRNFAGAGFDSFTLMIITFVAIFGVTITISKWTGLTNPEGIILVVWALVGLFSYAGWLQMDLPGLPTGFSGLAQYLIFYLVTLLSGAYIVWRHT